MQYLASDQSPVGSQTAEQVKNLLEALKPYPLTKSEKLQIINLRPERPVELYVVCFKRVSLIIIPSTRAK